jgi:2-hydroxychromene-2-carboxylate isomerase
MSASEPVFYYDFNSPYAYLAAHRVDGLMPGAVRWQPIAFGVLIGEIDKVPWSLASEESAAEGKRECEARAEAMGLPPLRWADGWPAANYSILVLRAALVADALGRLREFSLAAYEANFARAENLKSLDVVLGAAQAAGLEAGAVRDGVERPDIKARLREVTAAALASGVTGVPTVDVGGELFWGDDRLEEAAAAAA